MTFENGLFLNRRRFKTDEGGEPIWLNARYSWLRRRRFSVSQFFARTNSSGDEDSWKKFERNGGRFTKADLRQRQDGELSSPEIAEDRDLGLYDQGGHFNG